MPVFCTELTTGDYLPRVEAYLEDVLARRTTVHGSLADVYGIGVLSPVPAGSASRNAYFPWWTAGTVSVADDLVLISRRGKDVLMGKGHERQAFHMEIRGSASLMCRQCSARVRRASANEWK